jgi:hypothetical protein
MTQGLQQRGWRCRLGQAPVSLGHRQGHQRARGSSGNCSQAPAAGAHNRRCWWLLHRQQPSSPSPARPPHLHTCSPAPPTHPRPAPTFTKHPPHELRQPGVPLQEQLPGVEPSVGLDPHRRLEPGLHSGGPVLLLVDLRRRSARPPAHQQLAAAVPARQVGCGPPAPLPPAKHARAPSCSSPAGGAPRPRPRSRRRTPGPASLGPPPRSSPSGPARAPARLQRRRRPAR